MVMDYKSWDIKKKLGYLEIILNVLLLTIFVPLLKIKFSYLLFVFFFAGLLFRWKPLPLRKYSYLTLSNSISILLYLLYGPVSAAFWIFIFLTLADLIFKKGLLQALINGSAYALSIFIAGMIFGSHIMDHWMLLFLFFPCHYLLQNGVFFYLSEFLSRKTEKQEVIYIHFWESFYYILVIIISVTGYYVIRKPSMLNITLFLIGFLLLRWFVREISSKAIEGEIYRDLIKLQSEVMRKSFDQTLEAVVSFSRRYVDWTGFNIGKVDHEKKVINFIYSTAGEFGEYGTLPITKGITGKCVREGKAIIVQNTGFSKDYIALRSDVKSEMALPLISEDKVIGVIDFEHRLPNAFTEKEVEYAKFFSSQISFAFQTNIALQPLVKASINLREFTDKAYEATNQTREKMGYMLRQMEDIIKGGESQISSLQEVEKVLEALVASHENIKSLREGIFKKIEDFYDIVEKSKGRIEENLKSLNEISEAIESVEETVGSLKTFSGGIMDITNSSKEIAEDTSLLALNASIEAARITSSSSAFSVIAEEINNLAKTASNNSDQISKHTESIIETVNDLSNKTTHVVETTRNIEVASSSIMEQFGHITEKLSLLKDSYSQTIEVAKREIQNIEDLRKGVKEAVAVSEGNIEYIRSADKMLQDQNLIIANLNKDIKTLKDSADRLNSIVTEFRLNLQ